MTGGTDGRATAPGGSDDWSDTIEELLRVTSAAAAGGYPGSPSRGVTSIACLAVGTEAGVSFQMPNGQSGGRPPDDGDRPGDRDDGPLSTVHVQISPLDDPQDGLLP